MAYGKIKAEKLVYEDSGSDVEVAISTLGGKADVDGQTFTGNVVLPSTTTGTTQSASDNSTKLATTAYADAAVAGVDLSTKANKAGDTFTGPITVGVDDTGHDVKFFGATAGKYIQWDESADKVIIEGSVQLNGQTDHLAGSEHISMPTGGLLFQHNPGSGTENVLLMHTNYCKLYADNTLRLETTTDGVTITGGLVVNGTTTTIDSTTLTVEDKNIELGKVDTPTDTTADGGGITLKGATDKTILWTDATDSWDFNQDIKTSGTVSDANGNVRNITQHAQVAGTAMPSEWAGKHIKYTPTGAVDTTVNTSIFSAGDAVTIVNNSAHVITIKQGTATIYNSADGTTGDRALAGRGMATLLFTAADTCYISGAGLS